MIPLPPLGAVRHHRIVYKVDDALFIGVDKIKAGDVLQCHRGLPLFERGRVAKRQPLLYLSNLAHSCVAHGVSTMLGFHDGSVDRTISVLMDRPGQPSPQQHFDRDIKVL